MRKISIKNMVCDRCILVVREIFQRLNIDVAHVSLGEVCLLGEIGQKQTEELSSELEAVGFEIINDRRSLLIEQIKSAVRELVHNDNNSLRINLSDHIAGKVRMDYSYLATLFSETEGMTIERYSILQRTERVKELLVYDNLSLSEIADLMNYSSVAHLSAQFKKVTGYTTSHYKQLGDKRRNPLDKI